MTVEEFYKPYEEFFSIHRRSNQSKLRLMVIQKGTSKQLYESDIECAYLYMKQEYRKAKVYKWAFDYRERKIMLIVELQEEETK